MGNGAILRYIIALGGITTLLNLAVVNYFSIIQQTPSDTLPEHVAEFKKLTKKRKKKSASSSSSTIQINNAKKPLNILVLYPDDWRHDSIGGVGPVVLTPFLNKLAERGIRFTNNCVTTSICWISRATFFTGQYASRHKSYRPHRPHFHGTFNRSSWPGILRRSGYFTGHVGKWQFSNEGKVVENLFNWTNLYEGKHVFNFGGRRIHACDQAKEAAIEFLKIRPKDKPFSLTVAFFPPKAIGNSKVPGAQWTPKNESMALYSNVEIPMPTNMNESWNRLPYFFQNSERAARSRWEERFDGYERYQASMKNYYRLITEVDQACKEIIDELERQDVLNETLVIFTTDNGLFHGEHGLAGKWYPYQESIRVPLIIWDPRMPESKRNTVDDSFTLSIDLAETILGAANKKVFKKMQGKDISDIYLTKKGKKYWRSEFFYEYPLKSGKSMPMATALVRKKFKYIRWPEYDYEQLFHLEVDPLEENDIVNDTEYASILSEMRGRHDELEQEVK